MLREGATLRDLQALTREALAQDIAIGELNARRIGISRIKGGRLTARLGGRPGRALFISDVPHDDPAVIGSGLLGPASEGADRIVRRVVASSEQAVAAVAARAARARPERAAAGTALRRQRDAPRRALRARAAPVGGPGVRLGRGIDRGAAAQPGRGGRNQHLALAAARLIAGHADLSLLAAGTDGSDGVTEDAGALVDADTCARLSLARARCR